MIELTLFIVLCSFIYHINGMKSAQDKATAIFLRQRLLVGSLEIFVGLSTSIGCLAIPRHEDSSGFVQSCRNSRNTLIN